MAHLLEQRLQDEVEAYIEDLLAQGFTKSEIIEEIAATFEGFDVSIASDAYEDWENDNDPTNNEATIGDIEHFIDELEVEGFSRDEAIQRAIKRYKLSAQEIRNMIESYPAAQALRFLDNLDESLDLIDETVEEDCDYDEEVLQETAAPSELQEMGFDENQIAYLVEADELAEAGFSVEQIQEALGTGIVDEAILRATFEE